MRTPIPTYWWSPRRSARTLAVELRQHSGSWIRTASPIGRAFTNHGDELNAVVLPELVGRPVRWAPLGREELVGIGSVLVPYLAHGGRGMVLGSGDGSNTLGPSDIAPARDQVLAVRGPIVRAALGLDADLPLGDPGLAVRGMGMGGRRRSGRLVIPHFHVYARPDHRAALGALASAGYRVMGPTTHPLAMIDAISRAEFVVGSSLHGVILSHALGTPTAHVSFDGSAPAVPGHKFRDHNAAVGVRDRIQPWHVLLDETRLAAVRAESDDDARRVLPRVDELVTGLHRAAAPLRSAH